MKKITVLVLSILSINITAFCQFPNGLTLSKGNNLGIGGGDPNAKLHLKNGSIYIENPSSGIILKSDNGLCWRIGVDNIGSLTTTKVACPESVNLNQGLIAHYPLNGNGNDVSGNNYNGNSYYTTPTNDRFGNSNSAYYFNGNAYFDFSNNIFKLEEYSYSLWFKQSSSTSNSVQAIISIGSSCGDQNIGIPDNYFGTSGINGAGYNTPETSTVSIAISDKLPTLEKWTHAVVTRTQKEVSLFIDGEIVQSTSTRNNLPYYGCSSNTKALLGVRAMFSGSQYFIGSIDEVKIYNKALSSAEVKKLFNSN